MTARWPSGCRYAASSITFRQHAYIRLPPIQAISPLTLPKRQYAQKTSHFPTRQQIDLPKLPRPDSVKSALNIEEAGAKKDPINPPASTLPPPLLLPTRGNEGVVKYYWNIGRAYGTFYKNGVKAVWFNYKATKLLKERLAKDGRAKSLFDAVAHGILTRSELQMLVRNQHDIGKLPLFALLVLIFGEWLPLFIPLIPNTVPGTCRIPKQVHGMRTKAEERRRVSFLRGITAPSTAQLPDDGGRDPAFAWPVGFNSKYRGEMMANLHSDQLLHLSSTLTLHSSIWDKLQLPPPSRILRSRINRRLHYLTQDDYLLLNTTSGNAHAAVARLNADELHIACTERGLDILGKRDEVLRENLSWWLQRDQEDTGYGKAMLAMLFRRPIEWRDIIMEGKKGRVRGAKGRK